MTLIAGSQLFSVPEHVSFIRQGGTMIGKSSRLISGLLLAAVFLCGSASADDFHYTNLLIGDRASGMGGAYTAVSDDATGLYYNPAGVAYTSGRSISASVNAYYNTEKKYDSVIGGNGWVRKSSSLLPNYFGVVQPIGRFKVGISYAVPESIMEDQDQTIQQQLPLSSSIQSLNPGAYITSYVINFNSESTAYNFGPSIAMESDSFAAGLTLYYYQKKTQWILNQIIKTNTGGYEWTNDYYQVEEKGLRPILGFMFTPIDKFSWGLAVSRILVESSDTKFQHAYRRENIAVDNIPSNSNVVNLPDGQSSLGEKRKYPTQIALGAAFFPTPSLLISADLNYYTKVSQVDAKEVFNPSFGMEYYFSKTWAMRAGLYTNFANTPKVSSDDINQNEHIDLYGTTLSLSRFTRNTSVTLGTGYTAGKGKAQIISGSNKIQDAESKSWMFFLSSSYSY
jgi:long-chain fatty acid transport protein